MGVPIAAAHANTSPAPKSRPWTEYRAKERMGVETQDGGQGNVPNLISFRSEFGATGVELLDT